MDDVPDLVADHFTSLWRVYSTCNLVVVFDVIIITIIIRLYDNALLAAHLLDRTFPVRCRRALSLRQLHALIKVILRRR